MLAIMSILCLILEIVNLAQLKKKYNEKITEYVTPVKADGSFDYTIYY